MIERFEDRSITSEFRSELASFGYSFGELFNFLVLCGVYTRRDGIQAVRRMGVRRAYDRSFREQINNVLLLT